jgi:hypothetical protein
MEKSGEIKITGMIFFILIVNTSRYNRLNHADQLPREITHRGTLYHEFDMAFHP